MAKFSLNDLPEEKRIQMIAEFYDTIDSLKTREEVRLFFRDLLTPDEIAMLMRRIEVATLLLGGFTYEQIESLLGVGRGKVANVQRSLGNHGEGYRVAIKRLVDKRKSRHRKIMKKQEGQRSDFERMKQKYPLYFLLFNVIDEIGELLEEKKIIEDKEMVLLTPSRK